MLPRLLVGGLVLAASLAGCTTTDTASARLPPGYVWLGLFRNDNPFPVTVLLKTKRGIYLEMPLEPNQIDRTGIRSTTTAVVTSIAGKELFKNTMTNDRATKNYDSGKNTVYYRITSTAIISAPASEGRSWDR
jgi:hypothetical protein